MSDLKKLSEFTGKTVATSEGRVIGTVADLLVGVNWHVSDIQVKVEKTAAKEIGLKRPLIGSLLILVETSRVKAVTDQVLIDIKLDEFQAYVNGRSQS